MKPKHCITLTCTVSEPNGKSKEHVCPNDLHAVEPCHEFSNIWAQ